MPFKNKDGSPYRLRAPNPAMYSQDLWLADEVEYVNMDVYHEIVWKDARLDKTVPATPREEDVRTLEDRKVSVHCLPVTTVRRHDTLYDDHPYTREVFGDAFTFPAVITDQTDLTIQLWTDRDVPLRSVIFPRTMNHRWWRVTESSPRTGGYLLTGCPSEFSPSFAEEAGDTSTTLTQTPSLSNSDL